MKRPQVLYREFIKLNESAPPEQLKDEELVEAYNVEYSPLRKRWGTEKHVSNALSQDPASRVIGYSRESQLLVAHGTTLEVLGGLVLEDQLASVDFDWEVFSDGKLYLVNGDNYYEYDGTVFDEVTPADGSLDHIKRCKYIIQRGERFFAAGDPDYPNTIYFSEVGAPDNFPALNYINAVSDDDDIITGLAEFHDSMVAFKRHHIYAWFGWDPETDVRFDKINVHTGAVSHRTIHRAQNHLFYMGEDGVYALRGLEKSYISSASITNDVLNWRFSKRALNHSDAFAVFYDNKYILHVDMWDGVTTGMGGTPVPGDPIVLVFDIIHGAWSIWDGWEPADFEVYDGMFLYGSSAEAMVYRNQEDKNDDGEPIHFKVTTKPFDCYTPLHLKKFSWFYLLVGEEDDHNEINVDILCDYTNINIQNGDQLNTINVPGAAIMDEEVPTERSRLFYKVTRMLARSMRIQVTVKNGMVDEEITIYGIGFQFWLIKD